MAAEALLSIREVAELLGMSPRWVRTRCASGEIRAIRLCGDGPWRIWPDGLGGVLGTKRPVRRLVDRRAAYLAMAKRGLPPLPPDELSALRSTTASS